MDVCVARESTVRYVLYHVLPHDVNKLSAYESLERMPHDVGVDCKIELVLALRPA